MVYLPKSCQNKDFRKYRAAHPSREVLTIGKDSTIKLVSTEAHGVPGVNLGSSKSNKVRHATCSAVQTTIVPLLSMSKP
ncbi:hypothetical protein RRG08_035088 [Elysia crispata]|uniref:Uncharacterized protein n=1 Tax=Elysia crispata TaxID=231223 RepID=A0AAE1DL46_9GAST|nr:hypothetical protein RRG08_035088 [Elysia crispata]